MTSTTLTTLFQCKIWADRELLDTLAQLLPEQASALHASIRTLNHVHVVDRIFQAHLQGAPSPFTATNTEATPALSELRLAMLQTDQWFLTHAQAASAEQLAAPIEFRFTDGDQGRMTAEEMLMHVIAHGSYHRGNVGQILKSIGVAPPRDLYTRFLHEHEPQRRMPASA